MMRMVWLVIKFSDKWKAPFDKQEMFLGKQNVRAVWPNDNTYMYLEFKFCLSPDNYTVQGPVRRPSSANSEFSFYPSFLSFVSSIFLDDHDFVYS